MLEGKRKLIKGMVILGIITAISCFGIYYRLTTKISDYTEEDITIVKGTLKQKPIILGGGKSSITLEIELNEYKNVVFESSGIYLYPMNYKRVIAENNANDSIQISILNSDSLICSVNILELRTKKAVYLSLNELNKNLAIERPQQEMIIYPLTVVLLMVFISKLIRLINKDYDE